MDELLTRLIEAYNGTEGDRDARIAAARAALVEELGAEGADIDLGALVDAAIDRFNELSADADGGELSDDDLAVMEAVAGITLAAREEIAAADEVAAQRRARAEELAALVNGGGDDTDGAGDEGDDTGGADTDGGDGGGEGGGDGGEIGRAHV